MHKYQPRIHLVKRNNNDHHHSSQSNNQIVDLENAEYKTFIFPESVFTAVTAYQNQLVSYFLQFLFIFISTQIQRIHFLYSTRFSIFHNILLT